MSFEVTESKEGAKIFLTLSNNGIITERGIRKAWFATGKDLLGTLNKETLRKPRAGRTYVTRSASGRTRRHKASRPGEYHANRSGALRKSAGWKVKGKDLLWGYGVVKKAPDYAEAVEEGTKRMAKRPSVGNSVKANYRNTENNLAQAVLKEYKK